MNKPETTKHRKEYERGQKAVAEGIAQGTPLAILRLGHERNSCGDAFDHGFNAALIEIERSVRS